MSNSFTNTRKKVIASALVCSVLSLGFVGSTYAALTQTITTDGENETLINNLSYFYAWTVETDPIVAEVTPVETPVVQTFVKPVSNQASVPSHFALWVSGVDVAEIPDSILDNATVRVTIDDGTNLVTSLIGLRGFLTDAYLFTTAADTPFVVAPRTDFTMTFEVTAPTDDGTIDYSDVLDFESAGFVTNVTFNQIIGGTSDLWGFVQSNAVAGDETAYIVPLNGAPLTF